MKKVLSFALIMAIAIMMAFSTTAAAAIPENHDHLAACVCCEDEHCCDAEIFHAISELDADFHNEDGCGGECFCAKATLNDIYNNHGEKSIKDDTVACKWINDQSPRYITVKSEDDIIVFFQSEEYNPNVRYIFVCSSQEPTKILCPKCKHNNYRGVSETREMDIHLRMCPNSPDLQSDVCVEFHKYVYSFCDYCGYKTPTVLGYKYWMVQCHVELPGDLGTYFARPGQRYQDGYDFHEDPYYMNFM